MYPPVIDAHIHIDDYCLKEQSVILNELRDYTIKSLIAVSKNYYSAKKVWELAKNHEVIKPAYGYHPEQNVPTEREITELTHFIERNNENMVAIGEVGLPYYLKQEDYMINLKPYIDLLEYFIHLAKKLQKPIVLHAVYEDASVALDLLEKYNIKNAHFHWFKGDEKTIDRIIANGYNISVTPDILYKERTRNLVKKVPLHFIMAETDGPWPFTEAFEEQFTHPKMIHAIIKEIATIKQQSLPEVYEIIYQTTKSFYLLKSQ